MVASLEPTLHRLCLSSVVDSLCNGLMSLQAMEKATEAAEGTQRHNGWVVSLLNLMGREPRWLVGWMDR